MGSTQGWSLAVTDIAYLFLQEALPTFSIPYSYFIENITEISIEFVIPEIIFQCRILYRSNRIRHIFLYCLTLEIRMYIYSLILINLKHSGGNILYIFFDRAVRSRVTLHQRQWSMTQHNCHVILITL